MFAFIFAFVKHLDSNIPLITITVTVICIQCTFCKHLPHFMLTFASNLKYLPILFCIFYFLFWTNRGILVVTLIVFRLKSKWKQSNISEKDNGGVCLSNWNVNQRKLCSFLGNLKKFKNLKGFVCQESFVWVDSSTKIRIERHLPFSQKISLWMGRFDNLATKIGGQSF